ncbi:hypothetical protein T492DRAFT_858092, partial [Pavlovales sp. CCMP2436]
HPGVLAAIAAATTAVSSNSRARPSTVPAQPRPSLPPKTAHQTAHANSLDSPVLGAAPGGGGAAEPDGAAARARPSTAAAGGNSRPGRLGPRAQLPPTAPAVATGTGGVGVERRVGGEGGAQSRGLEAILESPPASGAKPSRAAQRGADILTLNHEEEEDGRARAHCPMVYQDPADAQAADASAGPDSFARGAGLNLLAEFEAKAAIASLSAERVAYASASSAAPTEAARLLAAGAGAAADGAEADAGVDVLSLRRPAAERLRLITARAGSSSGVAGARPSTARPTRAALGVNAFDSPTRAAAAAEEEEESAPALTRRLVRLLQDVAAERDGLRRQLARALEQVAALGAKLAAPPADGAPPGAGAALDGAERVELLQLRVEAGNVWPLLDENKGLREKLARLTRVG